MKISELMTRDVELVSPTDTIQQAAKIMARIDAGILPVADNDRLVGMIVARKESRASIQLPSLPFGSADTGSTAPDLIEQAGDEERAGRDETEPVSPARRAVPRHGS